MKRGHPTRKTRGPVAAAHGPRGAPRSRSGGERVASVSASPGNRAIHHVLQEEGAGRPLDAPVRAVMERAFAADLGSVRVHRGPDASRAADSLDAKAFTEGERIYLGAEAPAPDTAEGERLLSHEVAHVLQQRRAGAEPEDRVGRAGDAFEREADSAASAAAQGQAVHIAGASSVPAVQAQPKDGRGMAEPDLPFRAQVEKAIAKFLKRALKEQGGQALQITPAVRHAMTMLAQADDPRKKKPDSGKTKRITAVEELLGGSMRPGDPAAFAKKMAALLPNPMDKAALDRLETLPAADPPPKGAKGVAELVRRTTPPKPDFKEEPSGNAPLDRSEKNRQIEAGERGERTIPVFNSQGVDIIEGLDDAMKGRQPKKRPAPPDTDEEAGPPAAAETAEKPAPKSEAPAGRAGTIKPPPPIGELSLSVPTVIDSFPTGSAALQPDHRRQLDLMVDVFLSSVQSGVTKEIDIVGHADITGTEKRNQALSTERAEAVRDYLVGVRKVSPLMIHSVRGAGSLTPLAKGDSAAIRARNRAVKIVVRSRATPVRRPFEAP